MSTAEVQEYHTSALQKVVMLGLIIRRRSEATERAPMALSVVSRRCCAFPVFGSALIRLSAHLLSAGTRLPAAADPE